MSPASRCSSSRASFSPEPDLLGEPNTSNMILDLSFQERANSLMFLAPVRALVWRSHRWDVDGEAC